MIQIINKIANEAKHIYDLSDLPLVCIGKDGERAFMIVYEYPSQDYFLVDLDEGDAYTGGRYKDIQSLLENEEIIVVDTAILTLQ